MLVLQEVPPAGADPVWRRVPSQGPQQLRQRDTDLHLQRVRRQVRGVAGQERLGTSTVTATLAKRAPRRAGEAPLQAPPKSTQPVTFKQVAVSHDEGGARSLPTEQRRTRSCSRTCCQQPGTAPTSTPTTASSAT